MCLYQDWSKTRNWKFWAWLLPNREITCYKVLDLSDKKLYSPLRDFVWTAGINKSDAENTTNNYYEIHHGIHVYLKESSAKNSPFAEKQSIVAKVKCKLKHLIAVSKYEAVFTEVELEESEYNRFIKSS